MSIPLISTLPVVAASTPSTMLMVVVLPAPLGPSRPTISPRPTVNDTSSSATTLPYTLWSRLTRSAGQSDFGCVSGIGMAGLCNVAAKLSRDPACAASKAAVRSQRDKLRRPGWFKAWRHDDEHTSGRGRERRCRQIPGGAPPGAILHRPFPAVPRLRFGPNAWGIDALLRGVCLAHPHGQLRKPRCHRGSGDRRAGAQDSGGSGGADQRRIDAVDGGFAIAGGRAGDRAQHALLACNGFRARLCRFAQAAIG